MSKWKKAFIYGSMVILALCAIVLIIHSIRVNTEFFKVNAANAFTIIWAILFSFIITQMFTAHKRKSDVLVQLLKEVKGNFEDPIMSKIENEEDKKYVLMKKRMINNKLQALKKHADKFCIGDEIQKIEDWLKEYDDILSEHINDVEFLRKSETILARPLSLAAEKLFECMLKV